jgi:hypothetical protein
MERVESNETRRGMGRKEEEEKLVGESKTSLFSLMRQARV